MGTESCGRQRKFCGNFWSETFVNNTFVHAGYGARKVLCTGLVECGGVLVKNSKVQVTPTRGQNIEHAAPFPHAQLGTLHTTQSAQLVPPTSIALNLEVSNKAPALLYRTHARPHGRICDHLKRVWRFGARSGFDEDHAVSASSMGLSRHKRGREEGERRSR